MMEEVLLKYNRKHHWDDATRLDHVMDYLEFCVKRSCSPDQEDFDQYLSTIAG